MRLSFYNTIDKSSYFVGRFREEESLPFRRTNNFQNMMERAIASERIVGLLGKRKKEMKQGMLNC